MPELKINKKLICITGLDGIGKSTLIELLKKELESCYVATIWDLLNSSVQGLPFKTKQQLDDFICRLTPNSRFLFLAHALQYSYDKAFESSKKIVLFDSYYYKYVAAELTLGANQRLVYDVVKSFPEPDFVFELKLPLEEILRRKKNFSRYECGLSSEVNKKKFANFQKKVLKEWDHFSKKKFHLLDASDDPKILKIKILTKLNEK